MNKGYFVTGTGTGVGKSFICSLLCDALEADYWKPVQCGNLDDSDSVYVRSSSSKKINIIPEQYRLREAQSPHYAAESENKLISLHSFDFPLSDRKIIVEGAGGLLVPLNKQEFVIDLATHFDVPVILVAGYYLGAINHTILSLEYLLEKKYSLAAIFFNNSWPAFASSVIMDKYPSLTFIQVPEIKSFNAKSRAEVTDRIRKEFSK